METSLHRELKTIFAGPRAKLEVKLDDYRIDAVARGRLFEIQHGGLGAIRDKIRRLLDEHRVTVVKPIVVRKRLVKCDAKGGEVVDRRFSPKKGRLLDLFDEMVHFTNVFPHRRLTLEVPLVDVEEWRYPGHGRRRRWRENDHQVEDQKLLEVRETHRFRTAADLRRIVDWPDERPFHTGHLAESQGVPRWIAQRIAYCFRETGVLEKVGKERNALLYDFTPKKRRRGAA